MYTPFEKWKWETGAGEGSGSGAEWWDGDEAGQTRLSRKWISPNREDKFINVFLRLFSDSRLHGMKNSIYVVVPATVGGCWMRACV